jgi:hypothetical protein
VSGWRPLLRERYGNSEENTEGSSPERDIINPFTTRENSKASDDAE